MKKLLLSLTLLTLPLAIFAQANEAPGFCILDLGQQYEQDSATYSCQREECYNKYPNIVAFHIKNNSRKECVITYFLAHDGEQKDSAYSFHEAPVLISPNSEVNGFVNQEKSLLTFPIGDEFYAVSLAELNTEVFKDCASSIELSVNDLKIASSRGIVPRDCENSWTDWIHCKLGYTVAGCYSKYIELEISDI